LQLVSLAEGLQGGLLVEGGLGVDNEGEELLGESVHCGVVQTVREVN
jgi:hypothetical protein